ncbi:MAG: putative Fe-S cluster assembly protein SufT [Omnitrophica bacterium GWA2_52_8]|nr:MAG: putative Fe-S cluster assembly protein SufT [Omnitrophica bacterium GWA2_52_8]
MKKLSREPVTLKREVAAVKIPTGEKITLFKDTDLIITQALGGTFTVMTLQGTMASIFGQDADALGKEVPQEVRQLEDAVKEKKSIEDMMTAQLKTCFDPEIPYNIVDLGLVYERKILDLDGGKKKIYIRMTLTAPGCGMGDWISQDVKQKLLAIPAVEEVQVDVVWDPPWDREKMAPALRREFL